MNRTRYSHRSAGYSPHGQGRDGRVVERPRSRAAAEVDRREGFDGVAQGLSHREAMNPLDDYRIAGLDNPSALYLPVDGDY